MSSTGIVFEISGRIVILDGNWNGIITLLSTTAGEAPTKED